MLQNVTLHQLRIFLMLAKHMKMRAAAEELHMTPGALSIQIKQLAESLGVPLHEQIGKQLHLTATGRLVEAACKDVFGRLDDLAMELAEVQGLERGSLKLSIITIAKYFVPRLLGEFSARHPGIEAALEVVNRDQILERLRQNLDDLYIMGQVPEHLNVVAVPFMENPLVAVAPTNHSLVGRRDISPKLLDGEPFIAREPGSGTRLAAERFFEAHDVSPRIRMTLGSTEAIKQTVAGGLGLAVLSRHALSLDATSGAFAVLDIQGFPLVRHWYAVYPKGKKLSVVAQAFLDHLVL